MANTYWNAEVYDRIGKPMRQWAQQVIDDLALRGDETVLDAGCGSGSVTLDLLERLPRGTVYAVDASREMIASVERQLAERGITNVVPIHASLTDFELPERVDCVFSNAVFHWIPDDDALFGCLYRATKPGGRLRAQCGGYGNNARVLEAVAAVRSGPRFGEHLGDFRDSKKYRTPEEARASLERAGWRDVRARLFSAPVPFEDDGEAALYISTILLRDHVARLPEELRWPYAEAVVAETKRRWGAPYVADYVRLDLWAERPRA
ncbi:MAG TPA: methyltransferase domain-containing protein [Dehalococcoidia bacterium]|nr:methyltransferase domain-containing protein [Dehalococcoidia bacterium]